VTHEAILAVLKFSGPVVGLASALWSTTQKITYETADGVKRLTLHGRVLIGITVIATLISILSLGLETIIRRQQAEQAADQKADQDRAKAARRAERDAQIAARLQIDALRELRTDAAEQKRFLEQRFLIIGAAAEQQRRDAQISMQIAREANQRLSEAERTLAEFERINYPLRRVVVRVEVAFDFGGVDMAAFWRKLEADKSKESDRELTWRPAFRGGPDQIATFKYPQVAPIEPLDYATYGARVTLKFVTPGDAFPRPAGRAGDEIRPIAAATYADVPISFDLEPGDIEADLGKRTVTATFSGRFEPADEGVIGSGQKLSLSDVNRLVPILSIERRSPERRRPDTLLHVSLSLNDLERFGAPSNLGIADESAFILYLEPARR
jgi:hypothetical protein